MARLATDLWIAAYRARLASEGIAAYIPRRGAKEAGAVLVKLATMDGKAQLFRRIWDPFTDKRAWQADAITSENDVDAELSREIARDPDLWVIEIEDPHGRHMLDSPGLEG